MVKPVPGQQVFNFGQGLDSPSPDNQHDQHSNSPDDEAALVTGKQKPKMQFPAEDDDEDFLPMQRPPAPKGRSKMQPLTIQASEGSDGGSSGEQLDFMLPS